MLKKLKQRIIISVIIAGLFYLGFTLYADFNRVLESFSRFNWLLLPLLLILSYMNFHGRFIKWNYYLSLINVKIRKIDSISIFMSGLIMSVTPAKIGELIKSVLVREVTGEPMSKTAPIIFAERITDFLSLLILSIAGAYIFEYNSTVSIIIMIFFIGLIIVISNKNIALPLIKFSGRIPFIKKYLLNVHSVYESSYQLLKFKHLLLMTLLSVVSWSFECLGYYIILLNFDIDFGLLWAFFSYCFSTIIGAISMLPGGLGLTEGSLTFLLVQKEVPMDIAVATTFIIRVVTLWFAVLVGIASLSFYQKKFGKIKIESDYQNKNKE